MALERPKKISILLPKSMRISWNGKVDSLNRCQHQYPYPSEGRDGKVTTRYLRSCNRINKWQEICPRHYCHGIAGKILIKYT